METIQDSSNVGKGYALVVDDLPVNRKILQSLLKLEGYQTIPAENGQQAIQLFQEYLPDIVFMDVMMPVMDGYEAATRIKSIANTTFVPIIFLTALSEVDAMVKCIEAGGDDFLSKPFKQEILRAKIKSMERIRELSRTVAEQNKKIETQNQNLIKEQIIAEQIYSRAVTADNIVSNHIKSLVRAVSVFSGDMLLTAKCPDGKIHILLGDFTGHGLAASVGVLPTADIFRSKTAEGLAAHEILSTINSKLYKMLPTGMFLCACFVVIEKDMKSARVWNAGMPDILILSTQDDQISFIKRRVASRYLPLGIIGAIDLNDPAIEVEIGSGDRILMCSDGVNEATNSNGESFGMMRYEQAATKNQTSFQTVIDALDEFCDAQPFRDDASLVEIECMEGL